MAGWGNQARQLPLGNHVAQIRDVEMVTGKDFKDPSKTINQFKWGVDYWDGQKWIAHTIYTGQNFADLSKIDNPQFIPKLCLLVRACGEPLPQNAEQAAAWSENSLIGKNFVISVQRDEMLGKIETKWLQHRPQPAPAPATAPAPPTQAAHSAPAAPTMSPPAAPSAPPPFVPERELIGAVAGPTDFWK